MNTPTASQPPGEPPVIRAAAYVRMSTEHQQYSTSNQMDAIKEYAARRNMEIVTIYSDEGKSGLNIQGRGELWRWGAGPWPVVWKLPCTYRPRQVPGE